MTSRVLLFAATGALVLAPAPAIAAAHDTVMSHVELRQLAKRTLWPLGYSSIRPEIVGTDEAVIDGVQTHRAMVRVRAVRTGRVRCWMYASYGHDKATGDGAVGIRWADVPGCLYPNPASAATAPARGIRSRSA